MGFAKATTETDILTTFTELGKKVELFQKDSMKYRAELENFEEKTYLPAVDKMIDLVKRNACKKCLPAYLKSLAQMENSASEENAMKLKELIKDSATALDKGCKLVEKSILIKTKTQFEQAFATLDYEGVKGDKLKAAQTSVSHCLVP
jgi:hypothetical protein